MSSIQISNLNKRYGSFEAIPDLSLDIEDGEFVILVGPSGCGKSTLLRMLAGLESITGGDIRIDGQIVNDMMPRQRDIAMVFQSYALYPHMTVEQNMGFSLKMDKQPKEKIAEQVQRAASILTLEPLLKRKPSQLSGGQRQRVAMGRAIVRDPKVFLFDEPLSNLDAKLRVQMRHEIKALHQRLKSTIVYVTHDQIEALTMADRIVVMEAGKIAQVGAPLDLYDRPANRFVAEFLGSPSMNILEGTLISGALSMTSGASLPLPNVPASEGAQIAVGIRPEHLEVTGGPGDFAGEVEVVEPTGSDTVVVARVGPHALTCGVRGRTDLRPGQPVNLRADPAHLHFFDGGTGDRLAG